MELQAGTLYEANQQIMKQIGKPLNHLELAAKQIALEDWFNMDIDCYAMLLCNERKDYTIFHLYENQNSNPPKIAAKELIGALLNRGDVYAIDLLPDRAWEIWLNIDDEPYCYYLFNYDNAVIEC